MLRRCPREVSADLYLSKTAGGKFRPRGTAGEAPVMRRLASVIDRRSKETGKFVEGSFLAACCFALIEVNARRYPQDNRLHARANDLLARLRSARLERVLFPARLVRLEWFCSPQVLLNCCCFSQRSLVAVMLP